MRLSQKNLDYSLPLSILNTVKGKLEMYEYNKNVIERHRKAGSVNYSERSLVGSSFPTGVASSRTNHIARPTEEFIFGNSFYKDVLEYIDAQKTNEAIDRGIFRAAKTAGNNGEVKSLNEDLRSNLIYGAPNRTRDVTKKPINRGRTFPESKRKAYYFIAVELGLIEIDEKIARAEALRWPNTYV